MKFKEGDGEGETEEKHIKTHTNRPLVLGKLPTLFHTVPAVWSLKTAAICTTETVFNLTRGTHLLVKFFTSH